MKKQAKFFEEAEELIGDPFYKAAGLAMGESDILNVLDAAEQGYIDASGIASVQNALAALMYKLAVVLSGRSVKKDRYNFTLTFHRFAVLLTREQGVGEPTLRAAGEIFYPAVFLFYGLILKRDKFIDHFPPAFLVAAMSDDNWRSAAIDRVERYYTLESPSSQRFEAVISPMLSGMAELLNKNRNDVSNGKCISNPLGNIPKYDLPLSALSSVQATDYKRLINFFARVVRENMAEYEGVKFDESMVNAIHLGFADSNLVNASAILQSLNNLRLPIDSENSDDVRMLLRYSIISGSTGNRHLLARPEFKDIEPKT